MAAKKIANPQTIWSQRYQKLQQRDVGLWSYEPWLERWQAQLGQPGSSPMLELGCGPGRDTQFLTKLGFRVTAADYASPALAIAIQTAPQANFLQLDLRDGLPFPAASFNTIIASLCLHYFSWQQTRQIISQLHTRLRPDGYLLIRVNSTKDVNHGATGHQAIEANAYLVNGMLKRFFDRASLNQLFENGWQIIAIEEIEIMHRLPKMIWEVVSQKKD